MSVGLVVNPLAGIGGPAGLAGSDGAAVQREALRRGGRPRASARAAEALRVLAAAHPGAEVLTAAGAMGEDAVREAGLVARVVYGSPSTSTSPDDTTRAAAALHGAGATLVLFAGGDGTARDVARGLPSGVPVLGIPAGVKMYSGCFAVGPAAAGALAASWIDGALPTVEAEVLDLDEDRMRAGRPDPRLFALVPVPSAPSRTQARKAATPASEREAVHRAATGAAARMLPGVRYLLGPGGTTAELGRVLGLDTTPLGVDVVEDGRLVARDVTADQALAAIDGRPALAGKSAIVTGGAGGEAVAIAADVSAEADVERAVATAVDAFGGLDIAFNNAGIIRRTTDIETTVEEWDRVFGVNVRGIFLMCKHVVPVMAATGKGSIINTGSGWGSRAAARPSRTAPPRAPSST